MNMKTETKNDVVLWKKRNEDLLARAQEELLRVHQRELSHLYRQAAILAGRRERLCRAEHTAFSSSKGESLWRRSVEAALDWERTIAGAERESLSVRALFALLRRTKRSWPHPSRLWRLSERIIARN